MIIYGLGGNIMGGLLDGRDIDTWRDLLVGSSQACREGVMSCMMSCSK